LWNKNALEKARKITKWLTDGLNKECDSLVLSSTMFESRQLRAQRTYNRGTLLGQVMVH
jgi:predicted alpha-1,6-mannanase (GH76 family)